MPSPTSIEYRLKGGLATDRDRDRMQQQRQSSASLLSPLLPLLLLLLLLILQTQHAAAFFLRPSTTMAGGSSGGMTSMTPLQGQQSPPAVQASGGDSSDDKQQRRPSPPLSAQPPSSRPAWPRPKSTSNSSSGGGGSSSSSSKPLSLLKPARPQPPRASPTAKKQPPPPAAGGAPKTKAMAKAPADPQVFPSSILPPKVKPTTLIIKEPKQGLWVFEQPFVLGVTDVRNRMSVLRLSDGGFAVFSPLAATPECVGMLQALITKERLRLESAYFIAPSSYPEHHEALAAWRDAIPEARVVSITPKVNVIVEHLLEGTDEQKALQSLPLPLAKDLDVGILQAPLLRELIVCHRPSRTLFVADSGFYISEAYVDSALQRWFTQSQGIYNRFVTPPFFRLGTDLRGGRRVYQRALGWDFDRIVTCHADLVPMGEGKEAFREGYTHLK